MTTQFFLDWALWVQMTFILALAIVATFVAGFVKLWWMSRQKKKNIILDEEKRVKQQVMRTSRLLINDEEERDIPFGVRAIESGIQVDGIWVSGSNTPLTESLRSFQNSEASVIGSDGSISPGDISPRDESLAVLPLPTFRQTRASFEGVAPGECTPPAGRLTSSKQRESAYKPRQSSQLRFSSYGDIPIDQDTLSQLEGTAPQKQPALHHGDRSSYAPIMADSEEAVAADNERTSDTGSDRSLYNKEPNHSSCQSSRPSSTAALKDESVQSQIRRSDVSAEKSLTPNTGGPSSIAPSLPHPESDPFTVPGFAPTLSLTATPNMNVLPKDETEALGETQWPLLSREEPSHSEEPIFIPGTLHVNKTARKVNSGFEVLPAGTFDAPAPPMPAKKMGRLARLSKRLQRRRREPTEENKSSIC